MLTFLTHAGAVLLLPVLAAPPLPLECRLDRLVPADDRAVARFVAATHDYVASAMLEAPFNDEAARIFRFRLRLSRWLHRYHSVEALTEHPMGLAPAAPAAPGAIEAALPELPGALEYRVRGAHVLLVDRRTNKVVDLLPHAFEEGWTR